MTCGVYTITLIKSGRVYVGSSKNIEGRWKEHLRHLRQGRHANDRMQRAFAHHGEEAFVFAVIQVTEEDARIAREQAWMDCLGAYDRRRGFNLRPTADSPRGAFVSDETRAKLRAARIARGPITEEERAKISAALTGRPKSPEHIAKHAASLRGRKLTAEHRAKVAAAGIGRTRTAESIARSAAAHRGVKRSPEARAKMAEANRRRAAAETDEQRAKRLANMATRWNRGAKA